MKRSTALYLASMALTVPGIVLSVLGDRAWKREHTEAVWGEAAKDTKTDDSRLQGK